MRNPEIVNPVNIKSNDATSEYGPGTSDMGINLKVPGAKYLMNKEDTCFGANLDFNMPSVKTELEDRLHQSTKYHRCDQESKDLVNR